jgi:DNA-directed RNA polymerase specialized sigma24 family protein
MIASVAVTSSAGEAEAEGCREGAFGGRRLLSELLVASGRHDEAAFARLYQLTSPWIYYLLRRRTGSTSHAEDALRLVYTTIWQRAASFTPPNQSALAWVTAIAYDVVGL